MKRFTNDIVDIQRGNTDIDKVYRGQNLVWERGGSLDPDAVSFLTATAITDETITTAINNLVVGLKTNNLWTKMKVIYPVVGATANTHKYNLKDPRDLDAAFRLTFNGTWTHNANGMFNFFDGNDTNFANTHLLPNTDLDRFSNHAAVYTNIAKSQTGGYSGASSGTSADLISPYYIFSLRSYGETNEGQLEIFNNSTASVGIDSNRDTRGLNLFTRISDTELSIYRQKVRVATRSDRPTATPPANKILLDAIKTGTSATFGDDVQYAFCSFGNGLTQTDVNNLADTIESFQTTLSRNATPTPGEFPSTPV